MKIALTAAAVRIAILLSLSLRSEAQATGDAGRLVLPALEAVSSIERPGTEVDARTGDPGTDLQRSFIWLASAPVDQPIYAAFRKNFELSGTPEAATLHLFADSRYILWINGQYIERGPCRFDPIAPEYDTLNVRPYLKRGVNALAVLVHHHHEVMRGTNWLGLNGRMMRHAPGLTARLQVQPVDSSPFVLLTDLSWRGTTRTRFEPSPTNDWTEMWASIPERVDARRDSGDWTQVGFHDTAWEPPTRVDGSLWGTLQPRGTPRLRESDVGPMTLLELTRAGSGVKTIEDEPRSSPAALPLELRAGDQLVWDVGMFAQAYSTIDLEAEAGSELEVEYAQRFFGTGRNPSESYGRVNRYLARAGRQSYMSGDTFGFKYLVVRLKSGQTTIHGVRVINRLYPFDVAGTFHCNDPLLNQLWTNCVNTIRVCSEDAYVDCATRERVEWMADGYAVAYRTTRVALVGPGDGGQPLYADPRLLRNLLRHIGQSLQPDGRLKAHHPSDRWDIHGYIEDYSCLWVQALREYYDHTGDLALARELWPALTAQIQWFLDRRTTNGLVTAREFVYPGSNPLCYQVCEGTTFNGHLIRALRDASYLAGQMARAAEEAEYASAARRLDQALDHYLWDDASGTYRSGIVEGRKQPPSVPAAFIPLALNIVPVARRQQVQQWLLAHCSNYDGLPYAHQFLFEALYGIGTDHADRMVLSLIRQKWATMAQSETQTVWEGFSPGENCHEAGAVPAYFLSAFVLGVRLDEPATARHLLIQPRLADLKDAEGTVVTELGLVTVRWKRNEAGTVLDFGFDVPPGARATVALPDLDENAMIDLDGGTLPPLAVKRQGRYRVFEAGPGRHQGCSYLRQTEGRSTPGPVQPNRPAVRKAANNSE